MAVWPNMLCTMALATIGCTPFLGYNVPNSIKLGLVLLWVFTAGMFHWFSGKEKGINIVLGVLAFIALQLSYSFIGKSREVAAFLAHWHNYIFPIAAVYIINHYNLREVRLLWYFIIALFGVNLASNLLIGFTQGDIAFRTIAENAHTNAGGTAFVVGSMLLIPILWMVLRSGKSRSVKALSICFIIALVYYILFMNTRATAMLILFLIMLGFIIVDVSKKKQLTQKQLLFRMFLIGLVLFLFMIPIMNMLSGMFSENYRMAARLTDISTVMEQGDVDDLGEGSLYVRSLLWLASINTFLGSVTNFLFGVGESVIDTDFYSLLENGVSNHSEFFDLAARYGLLGITIVVFVIKSSRRFFNALSTDRKIRNYLFAFFIGVLVFGFFNNLSNNMTSMLMIFLVLPLTVILINRKVI